MVLRWAWTSILVLALITAGGLLPAVAADESLVLVVVEYADWTALQRLASLDLNVLDLQDATLAAVVDAPQLQSLGRLGLRVRVLDTPAHPDEYYLVSGRSQTGASPPTGAGQSFDYAPGLLLVRASQDQIERWSDAGFWIEKLFGPVVLPTAAPAPEPVRAAAPLPDPLIQPLVDAVSQSEIHDTLQFLQDDPVLAGNDALGSRYSYSSKLPAKRDYVKNKLQALGLTVRLLPFTLGGKTLYNIEATLPGWGPSADVINIACAHYDSITTNEPANDPYTCAPGADDNGSGTAGVLEAARVLSSRHFNHTLRFLLFPGEEQGIYGSYYYAADAYNRGDHIGGVVNLDMVSWDSNHDRHMDIHAGTRADSQVVGAAFRDANTAYGLGLVPQYITQGALTFSDHSRFWNKGFPAIMVIEDYSGNFNTNYHTTRDTLATLDLPYAKSFVQATVATISKLAEMVPPGLAVEHSGPGAVMTGTTTALTVAYSNASPDAATGVLITDTLGTGLTYVSDSSGLPIVSVPASGVVVWQVGGLGAFSPQRSFVITVSVAAGLPAGAHLTSTVRIGGQIAVDVPDDNQAQWSGFVASTRQYLPVLSKDAP